MITVSLAISLLAKAAKPLFGVRRTSKNSLIFNGATEVNDKKVLGVDEELEVEEREAAEELEDEEDVDEGDGESVGGAA